MERIFINLADSSRLKSPTENETPHNPRLLAKLTDRLLAKIAPRMRRRGRCPAFNWDHARMVIEKAFPLHTYDQLKRKYASDVIDPRADDKDGKVTLPKKRRGSRE